MNDKLREYAEVAASALQCPFDAVDVLDGVMGLTMQRQGDMQTQLWLCQPDTEIPDHVHPDVETLLMYVSGDLVLRVNGKSYTFDKKSTTTNPQMHRGAALYVAPGSIHGLSVGKLGGAFISVQRWTNGTPVSLDKNWKGATLGPVHDARLWSAVQSMSKT